MGLNIKLLVHGVPYGQKKWGADEEDSRYLSSFYGPKSEIPEVMKVEIMASRKEVCCYYTFLKGINVCDFNGRSGSYVALTFKVNAYYADILNIYNILKAAYEKMCVGLCVSDDGTLVKYLVPDFQNISSQLDKIEQSLVDYIGTFSVNSDIISFSRLKWGHDGTVSNINLAECTNKKALGAIQKSGCLFVSPYFLSASANARIVQQQKVMHAEKQRIQSDCKYKIRQALEKIASIQNETQRKIEECQRQTEKEKTLLLAEHSKEMQDLRESYSNYETEKKGLLKKIDAYKSELKEKQVEIESLKNLQTKDELMTDELVEQSQRMPAMLNLQNVPSIGSISNEEKQSFFDKKLFSLSNSNIFVVVGCIFLLLFSVIVVYALLSKNKQQKNDIESLKIEYSKLQAEKSRVLVENESLKEKLNENFCNKEEHNEYTIDVKEITKKKPYVFIGKPLTITIKPREIPGGEIQFDGKKIKKNKVSVSAPGEHKITYVVDGTIIVDRIIEARDK